MNRIIYVKSCIECPYVEVDLKDIYYCKRSAGRDIGHEDEIKHIPEWCKLEKPEKSSKKAGK